MELLWCFIVAGVLVSDWFADIRDTALGRGKFPRHERRVLQRQQDHEARMAKQAQRHAERMAGKGGPTIGEAVAERVKRGPKTRAEMGPLRGWWFDLCDDTARRLTAERRARQDREARGDGDARRAWEWTVRHAKAWQERNRARREESRRDEQPQPRVHETAERTDWPDPGAPDTTPVDAEVVDHPKPSKPEPRVRPELEPGWPEWGATTPRTQPVTTQPENPPATVRAVAERIPELPKATPAGNAINQGALTMAEIFNPESARADAETLETEANGLIAALDQRIGELDTNNVTGEPRAAYVAMQEAAVLLRDAAASAGTCFANHQAIHDVVHSDDSVGNGQYLEIEA